MSYSMEMSISSHQLLSRSKNTWQLVGLMTFWLDSAHWFGPLSGAWARHFSLFHICMLFLLMTNSLVPKSTVLPFLLFPLLNPTWQHMWLRKLLFPNLCHHQQQLVPVSYPLVPSCPGVWPQAKVITTAHLPFCWAARIRHSFNRGRALVKEPSVRFWNRHSTNISQCCGASIGGKSFLSLLFLCTMLQHEGTGWGRKTD